MTTYAPDADKLVYIKKRGAAVKSWNQLTQGIDWADII